MADKKSFILYKDQKEIIDELSDEEAGKLFKAIYQYIDTKKVNLTGSLKLIFIPFRNSFDRDEKKYDEIVEKRSNAGKNHTGNQYTRKKEREQMEQVFQSEFDFENKDQSDDKNDDFQKKLEQNGTNGTVSVSVSDSVNVSDSVSVSVNKSVPNTHTPIFEYCLSIFKDYDKKDLEKSCKKFFQYYDEKNWVGVNDWKKKVEIWINNDIDDGKIKEIDVFENKVDEAGFVHKNGRRIL